MPAQGTALEFGSYVENSNALKGQNRFVVKDPQGRPRKRGSPRLGFPVSAPSGRQKSATPKLPVAPLVGAVGACDRHRVFETHFGIPGLWHRGCAGLPEVMGIAECRQVAESGSRRENDDRLELSLFVAWCSPCDGNAKRRTDPTQPRDEYSG